MTSVQTPTRSRALLVGLAVVIVAVVGVVGYFLLRSPECRGISREAGGCDPDLAPYTASTCLGIAEEWGQFVNTSGLATIAAGQGKAGTAAKVTTERWTITQLANYRLRDLGLVADCDAEEFYDRGSQEFSDELLRLVPDYLFDVQFEDKSYEARYAEWEADVKKAIAMIDQQESTPAPPP